ncbi:DUF4493 domain-containing protein [Alistipes sp. ZOR0009]|uniref:DUF4493 domain-containing protein n=1 Tax=Alistipes sp. ZOR0009 TaxID=1339253 RepID=UPI0006465CF9|nr:DUF4493 domain-containing protein [Alistipes sp. ZOR0009]
MKNYLIALLAVAAFSACSKSDDTPTPAAGNGFLKIKAEISSTTIAKSGFSAQDLAVSIIRKKDGQAVKTFDKYAEIGENNIELPADTYVVKTTSGSFSEAKWDTPAYEATKEVTLAANATEKLTLTNIQTNAGVKITYTESFKKAYSSYNTLIESESGNLIYGIGEQRTGYFKPGNLKITTTNNGTPVAVFTRNVNAQELANVEISYQADGTQNGKIVVTFTVIGSNNTFTEDVVILNPTKPGEGGTTPGDAASSLFEDFSTAQQGGIDGSGSSGWPGDELFKIIGTVYQAGGAIRVGSSSTTGAIENKYPLNLSANNGTFTIKFKAKGWNADAQLIVVVNDQKQAVTLKQGKSATSLDEYTLTFSNGTSNTIVRFETGKEIKGTTEKPSRFFIDDISINK